MHLAKFIFIFSLLCIQSTAFSQYYFGRYYDLSGEAHEGYIRKFIYKEIGVMEDDNIYFKTDKFGMDTRISANDLLAVVIREDSFITLSNAERKINLMNRKRRLVEVAADGKITFYIHHVASGIPLYVENDSETKPTYQKLYYIQYEGELYSINNSDEIKIYLIPKIQESASTYALFENEFQNDRDLLTIIKHYNAQFPDYHPSSANNGRVLIYRTNQRQNDQPITLVINKSDTVNMFPNMTAQDNFADGTSIEICAEGNCINVTVEKDLIKYVNCSQKKKASTATIAEKSEAEGAYYVQQIMLE